MKQKRGEEKRKRRRRRKRRREGRRKPRKVWNALILYGKVWIFVWKILTINPFFFFFMNLGLKEPTWYIGGVWKI